MLQTTRGIVFRTIKYSDTSLIAKIYTEKSGMQSFMVRGLRNKKSNIRKALFQPLMPVELVIHFREKNELQNLKEIKAIYPFNSIPFDIRKSTILMFLNEVLYQVVREEEANPDLFTFLIDAVIRLDMLEKSTSSFHLLFLMALTKFLGFFPVNNYSEQNPNFNLMEGRFSGISGPETVVVVEPYSRLISELITSDIFEETFLVLPPAQRNGILDILVNYYRHHVPDLKEFKSHVVLRQVMG